MDLVKTKFFFKSTKEKDADGNVVMIPEVIETKDSEGRVTDRKETGKQVPKVIPAPKPLETNVMLLTPDDIVAILNSGSEKQVKLLLESANAAILEQARVQVNDSVEEVREKGLDFTLLSWEAIANLPPAQRRGSGISDEKWEGFTDDYVSVMIHHGKTEEKAKTGAKLFVQKYQPVKTNKKVIKALKDNLQLWFANTSDGSREEYQDVYENLMSKADTLLEKDEDAILAAV